MKYVYFHIGPPKTGSTSIQRALKENQKKIKKFYIPKTGITTVDLINHANLAFDILGDTRFEKKFGDVNDLVTEIKDIDQNILISSEDLFFLLIDKEKKNLFEKKINNLGFKIKYICYLRGDNNYFYSASNEFIRHKFKEKKKNHFNQIYFYLTFFISAFFKGSFTLKVHGINKTIFFNKKKMQKILQNNSTSEFIFIDYSKKNLLNLFFNKILEEDININDINLNVSHKKNLKYYLLSIFGIIIFLRHNL